MVGRVPSIALYFRVFSSHFLDFRRFWPSPCGDQLRVGDRGAPLPPLWLTTLAAGHGLVPPFQSRSGTFRGRWQVVPFVVVLCTCQVGRADSGQKRPFLAKNGHFGPFLAKNGHFGPKSAKMRDLVGSSAKKVNPAEKKTEKHMNGEQRQNAIQQ